MHIVMSYQQCQVFLKIEQYYSQDSGSGDKGWTSPQLSEFITHAKQRN